MALGRASSDFFSAHDTETGCRCVLVPALDRDGYMVRFDEEPAAFIPMSAELGAAYRLLRQHINSDYHADYSYVELAAR